MTSPSTHTLEIHCRLARQHPGDALCASCSVCYCGMRMWPVSVAGCCSYVAIVADLVKVGRAKVGGSNSVLLPAFVASSHISFILVRLQHCLTLPVFASRVLIWGIPDEASITIHLSAVLFQITPLSAVSICCDVNWLLSPPSMHVYFEMYCISCSA